jgi:galactofuranose transport system ATP-binding protein
LSQKKAILDMTGINKTFPGVKALSNVNFDLKSGEIHALMGENGAGKSTLIKVLTGVEKLEGGEILLEGKKILSKSPQHAQQLGISTVYQEVNLCTNLSVAENIFIGREPIKAGKINWKEVNKRSEEILTGFDLHIDVTRNLSEYSIAVQQMVAIARAVDISAKVLILDEPTSSLDVKEVEKLFSVMEKLKGEGMGIIFVTHFLDQVYRISDRITVLRNGELVGSFETKSLTKVQLIGKMLGKEFEDFDVDIKGIKETINDKNKKPYISIRNMGKAGSIKPFDLDIYDGEVIGLVGLLGSGRTESAKVIFGVDKADNGEISIDNKKVSIKSTVDAIKNGMGLCPENRKTEGIINNLTVRENIILALQGRKGLLNFLPLKEQEKFVDEYIKLLNISTTGGEQLAGTLSGGNQQKLILARWLLTKPKFLILDEPTRGIDVGAKVEIQKLILSLAKKGMSVMFISSELDEVLRCCSRISILRDTEKISELSGDQMTESAIMHTIAGGQ